MKDKLVIAYICDGKECESGCSDSECTHTTNISHAKNFRLIEPDTYIERRPSMTVDELKKEAAALGYKLIKKEPYVKFVPCSVCGNNRRRSLHRWLGPDDGHEYWFECMKCGRRSSPAPTEKEAKALWNAENEKGDQK